MPIYKLMPIHEVLQATEGGDSEGGYGKGEITRGPIGTKMCPVTSPPFPTPWLSGLIPAQFGRKKAPKKRPGGAPSHLQAKYAVVQSAPSDLQSKYAVVQSAPSHLQSKYAVVQSAPSHLQSKYAVVQSAPSHFTSYIIQYWSQRLTITMSGHKMHRVRTTSVGFYKIIMANTSDAGRELERKGGGDGGHVAFLQSRACHSERIWNPPMREAHPKLDLLHPGPPPLLPARPVPLTRLATNAFRSLTMDSDADRSPENNGTPEELNLSQPTLVVRRSNIAPLYRNLGATVTYGDLPLRYRVPSTFPSTHSSDVESLVSLMQRCFISRGNLSPALDDMEGVGALVVSEGLNMVDCYAHFALTHRKMHDLLRDAILCKCPHIIIASRR
ncbi:hypothetical protein FKP32DRAFT_1599711 [Trametes sanguinea]|nr:hypothetical protein FKP32DRAFT_1599711 [Trametes sanguinea]